MEMPEGWHKLRWNLSNDLPITKDWKDDLFIETEKAMYFLKEMVEVLEEFATSTEDDYTNSADRMLKKFKEWKC